MNIDTKGHGDKTEEDSLGKRYFFKLVTNFVSLFINIIIQAVVPRSLGPRLYGDFNFITNFFNQILSFIDMGTSIAFYTKLSQRPKDYGLISFYLIFSTIASIITLLFVIFSHFSSYYTSIWPEQEIFYVYLAAVWGIMVWFTQVLNKITDAYGLTVPSEFARIIQKVISLVLILVLFYFDKLNLANFFYYNFIVLIFLMIEFIWILKGSNYSFAENARLNKTKVKGYIIEFYEYCAPLITIAVIVLVVGILERWLLQKYAGSEQQGFYSLGFQIGTVCFLFTSAMSPLLMREFSIAYAKKDIHLMASQFRKYVPLLYSIAAYFSCFIAVQSETVVAFFGGEQYREAVMTVTVMSFYQIHQTYGQQTGAVFYATGQTKLYRDIGIIITVLGLPVTYFLIAPVEKMGLDTGATGLAVKMVLMQIIGVNVQIYHNTKYLGLSYWKYLVHQIVSPGCMLLIAWVSLEATNSMKWLNQQMTIGFLASCLIYSLLVLGLVYRYPVLFGLNRQDITALINRVREQVALLKVR